MLLLMLVDGSYYHFDRKTIKKQNRTLEVAVETYLIINARKVFISTSDITEEQSKADLRNDQLPFN